MNIGSPTTENFAWGFAPHPIQQGKSYMTKEELKKYFAENNGPYIRFDGKDILIDGYCSIEDLKLLIEVMEKNA